jgi:hypothetical protein
MCIKRYGENTGPCTVVVLHHSCCSKQSESHVCNILCEAVELEWDWTGLRRGKSENNDRRSLHIIYSAALFEVTPKVISLPILVNKQICCIQLLQNLESRGIGPWSFLALSI